MRLVIWMIFALLLCSLTACGGTAATTTSQQCTGTFEATVHQGPDAGLSVVGDLKLQIDPSGTITGVVSEKDGTQIVTSGQTIGQAISLLFDVGGGKHIFGVGTLEKDRHECKGVVGGPMSGPRSGDSGDWSAVLGK